MSNKKIYIRKISKEEVLSRVFRMLNKLTDNGLTQKEIASYIGVSDRTIRNWNNKKSYPTAESYLNLVKLCKIIDELNEQDI